MKWLLQNIRTLMLAFALALVVWISAVVAADPDETQIYPRPVTIQWVGQDPAMLMIGKPPSQVTVTLRAPRSVWQQLNAADLVTATVDLSGLAEGQHSLPLQLQVNARPVRVVTISPARVDVTLEALATRAIPIRLDVSGEPAIGYLAGKPVLSIAQASVSGPQSLVAQVSALRAPLPLSSARTTFDGPIALQAVNAEGQSINGLTINPPQVKVNLPITQQGGYRDLAVKVLVRGQVAGGYRLTNISVFPPTVTVFSGDPALVNALPGYVETEDLNLSGSSQDVERRLALALPPGVSVVGEQTVLVQVGVAAIEGSLALNNMPVKIIGLAPTLSAQIAPTGLDIILTGPLPLLDGLTADQLEISVDVAGLGPGTYQLTPQVVLLMNELQVQSINPATVEVIISAPPRSGG
ncbi:MAG: CdaR family protein [Anaerolineales bacterium]